MYVCVYVLVGVVVVIIMSAIKSNPTTTRLATIMALHFLTLTASFGTNEKAEAEATRVARTAIFILGYNNWHVRKVWMEVTDT
jgi:hypothetical protein